MEEFIEERFSSTAVSERKRIVDALAQLGVDSVEDLPLLQESDLTGKIKPIHARKLLQIAKEVAAAVDQEDKKTSYTKTSESDVELYKNNSETLQKLTTDTEIKTNKATENKQEQSIISAANLESDPEFTTCIDTQNKSTIVTVSNSCQIEEQEHLQNINDSKNFTPELEIPTNKNNEQYNFPVNTERKKIEIKESQEQQNVNNGETDLECTAAGRNVTGSQIPVATVIRNSKITEHQEQQETKETKNADAVKEPPTTSNDTTKKLAVATVFRGNSEITENQETQNSTNTEASEPDPEPPATENNTSNKNITLATDIIGGAVAIAAPLAVLGILFPPIGIPLAVAVKATVGFGLLGAAAAGTGVADAVAEAVTSHRDNGSKNSENRTSTCASSVKHEIKNVEGEDQSCGKVENNGSSPKIHPKNAEEGQPCGGVEKVVSAPNDETRNVEEDDQAGEEVDKIISSPNDETKNVENDGQACSGVEDIVLVSKDESNNVEDDDQPCEEVDKIISSPNDETKNVENDDQVCGGVEDIVLLSKEESNNVEDDSQACDEVEKVASSANDAEIDNCNKGCGEVKENREGEENKLLRDEH